MLLECSCIYKGLRDIVFIGEKGESQREGEGGREKERERERERERVNIIISIIIG